ncbi:hypothetical protein DFP73DRAFT_280833 [Morchella snyderi]|nr:hypothetical protein DFP73DRAFT_280833 [Morchella snyderi]
MITNEIAFLSAISSSSRNTSRKVARQLYQLAQYRFTEHRGLCRLCRLCLLLRDHLCRRLYLCHHLLCHLYLRRLYHRPLYHPDHLQLGIQLCLDLHRRLYNRRRRLLGHHLYLYTPLHLLYRRLLYHLLLLYHHRLYQNRPIDHHLLLYRRRRRRLSPLDNLLLPQILVHRSMKPHIRPLSTLGPNHPTLDYREGRRRNQTSITEVPFWLHLPSRELYTSGALERSTWGLDQLGPMGYTRPGRRLVLLEDTVDHRGRSFRSSRFRCDLAYLRNPKLFGGIRS